MNTNFLNSLTNFLKKRTFEFAGLALISIGIILSISFATYNPSDPSLVYSENINGSENTIRIYGSFVAEFLLQSFGLASFLLLFTFISWGINLIVNKNIGSFLIKISFVVFYLITGSIFLYKNFNESFWLIDNGNSGFVGRIAFDSIYGYIPQVDHNYFYFGLLVNTLLFFIVGSKISIIKII